MSVDRGSRRAFDAVTIRHRLLVVAGTASTLFGLAVAAFVGYEWFVRGISHEVFTMIAGVALLFGVQILVLASLTSMLITLHREMLREVEADAGTEAETEAEAEAETATG